MRSALLNSLCAAIGCAAVVTVTAVAQPASSAIPAPAAAVPAVAIASDSTLLAAVTAAPGFSSSAARTDRDAAAPDMSLPDAPVAALSVETEGQTGFGGTGAPQQIAPKYAVVVLAGQGAKPLSAHDKVILGFRDAVSPYSALSRVVSATYSHAVDSQPHYGQGWAPYGQRVGAAFARGTVQTLATESLFSPIFHDDPRYYVLGRQHKFLNRVVYAATRVVITRGDNGHNRLNAPLLLGYAAASGANFAYYPERDRNFGDAATGYAGSLGGGVLGMEVNEFIDDALRIVHLRRN